MSKRTRGFTLVEIAVLLVTLSLVLATSVKAAEWVDSSKVRSLAAEFREAPVMLEAYRSIYRQLPGDDPVAGRFPDIATAVGAGDGVIDGGWNSEDSGDESFLLWQNLRAARLAGGLFEFRGEERRRTYLPRNVFGGRIGIQAGDGGPIAGLSGAQIMCSAGIPARAAERLDRLLDDGMSGAGRMRAARETGIPQAFRPGVSALRPAVSRYVEGDSLTVCMAF